MPHYRTLPGRYIMDLHEVPEVVYSEETIISHHFTYCQGECERETALRSHNLLKSQHILSLHSAHISAARSNELSEYLVAGTCSPMIRVSHPLWRRTHCILAVYRVHRLGQSVSRWRIYWLSWWRPLECLVALCLELQERKMTNILGILSILQLNHTHEDHELCGEF